MTALTGNFRKKMVKFEIEEIMCTSGTRYWAKISDNIDGKKVRKLQGFLSVQRCKVKTKTKLVLILFLENSRSAGKSSDGRGNDQI